MAKTYNVRLSSGSAPIQLECHPIAPLGDCFYDSVLKAIQLVRPELATRLSVQNLRYTVQHKVATIEWSDIVHTIMNDFINADEAQKYSKTLPGYRDSFANIVNNRFREYVNSGCTEDAAKAAREILEDLGEAGKKTYLAMIVGEGKAWARSVEIQNLAELLNIQVIEIHKPAVDNQGAILEANLQKYHKRAGCLYLPLLCDQWNTHFDVFSPKMFNAHKKIDCASYVIPAGVIWEEPLVFAPDELINEADTKEIQDKLYAEHYDDSSDEEDVHDRIVDDIAESLAKFGTSLDNDKKLKPRKQQFTFSFISYSFGLMIYNAAKVKAEYHNLKKRYLELSNVPSEEMVGKWIYSSISLAISQELDVEEHPKASEKLVSSCITSLQKEISALNIECLNNKRHLIRSIKVGLSLPEAIQDKLSIINDKIRIFVADKDNYKSILLKDFALPKRVTANNLYEVEKIKYWFENKFKEELKTIDQMHNWLVNGSFKGVKTLLTKGGAFSSAGYIYDRCNKILENFELADIQKKYVEKIGELDNAIDSTEFKEKFKKIFLLGKIRVKITAEQARGADSILQEDHIVNNANFESSNFADFYISDETMEDFIPYNTEMFQELLEGHVEDIDVEESFVSKLKINSKEMLEPYALRTTLPTMFVHIITSCIEYLASLRLTNRSTARTVQNQINETSVFGDSKETNHDSGWRFPASKTALVVERSRITRNARSTIIPMQTGANSYGDIIKSINTIKGCTYELKGETRLVSDQDIALWVRKVVQCEELNFPIYSYPEKCLDFSPKMRQDLTQFIIQLAHLLSGTEAMRYPGAIVENQMAVDLVLAGKFTWDVVLDSSNPVGSYIPMTMEKATNISRTLITTYSQYTKHRYSYTGDPDKDGIRGERVSQFVAAEGRLATSWLEMIKQRDKKESTTYVEAVKKSISSWYPGL